MRDVTQLRSAAGIVVIGRNEGERLTRCLESVVPTAARVVYVDSGSTDGSVAMARRKGVEVVELDKSVSFCAARARNAGYQRLLELDPQLQFVQFIDGDCEMIGDWLPFAVESLENRPEVAIATGWLRERSPELSIYNRLGDLEWNFTGVGDVDSVGGIFMIRCEAFESVGGFDPTIAAGEEPELCQRLSRKGWRFLRLDHKMAWHDSAMMRFGQWWKRMVRLGYGSMDVAERFGVPGFRRDSLRARFWTAWLATVATVGALAAASPLDGGGILVTLMLLSLWPAQLCRICYRTWRKGHPFGLAAAHAFFIMLSFWPKMAGQLLYRADRLRKRSLRLVEYKSP